MRSGSGIGTWTKSVYEVNDMQKSEMYYRAEITFMSEPKRHIKINRFANIILSKEDTAYLRRWWSNASRYLLMKMLLMQPLNNHLGRGKRYLIYPIFKVAVCTR